MKEKSKSLKFNKKAVRDYFFIAVGAAVMAIGIGVFLVDAKVVPGGVSGLSMAIYYLSAFTKRLRRSRKTGSNSSTKNEPMSRWENSPRRNI